MMLILPGYQARWFLFYLCLKLYFLNFIVTHVEFFLFQHFDFLLQLYHYLALFWFNIWITMLLLFIVLLWSSVNWVFYTSWFFNAISVFLLNCSVLLRFYSYIWLIFWTTVLPSALFLSLMLLSSWIYLILSYNCHTLHPSDPDKFQLFVWAMRLLECSNSLVQAIPTLSY